jgi:heme/copper-type cytochrome/quinol oxidase subunit 3
MIWPPINIVVLNPWAIPLLNTSILLLSGLSITWVHFAIIAGNYNNAVNGFIVTLVLAVAFTGLQIGEYFDAPFNFTDSVYVQRFLL